MQRRNFLATFGAGLAAGVLPAQYQTPSSAPKKSRFKQATMKVNFGMGVPLDDMCRAAAKAGCVGFDLIPYQEWPILKKHGLIPTMEHDDRVTFEDGIIHPEVHAIAEKATHESIDRCAANGCPNTIVVGGQRRGMPYEQGIDNAVAFLNKVKAHAEDKGVTVLLEPVNPVDRPDQILNRLGLTVEICKRVNSPRVKLLFDIYHAQRIDGDVVENIRRYYPWIGHFHTAGVPGRHEIDDTQELNYHFIAQAIADLEYAGIIAHEWRPSPGRDPVKSLEQAVRIMTV
jgi:hydroxypyruvate isomerase